MEQNIYISKTRAIREASVAATKHHIETGEVVIPRAFPRTKRNPDGSVDKGFAACLLTPQREHVAWC
jgi:hypothetical protein